MEQTKELPTKQEEKVEKEVKKRLRQRIYEQSKNSASRLGAEFKKQTTIAITAALAFLIALSWREPLSELVNVIKERLGLTGELIYYQFISAVIVTIIAVLVLIIISKWASEKK